MQKNSVYYTYELEYIESGFIFRYKTGEIGLMMSRTKLSKHILHKDIETKLEEVGQKKDLEK